MGGRDFEDALERLVTDPGFAADLAADPDSALVGYRLAPDEAELLRRQVSAEVGGEGAVETRTNQSSVFGLLGSVGGLSGLGEHLGGAQSPGPASSAAQGIGPASSATEGIGPAPSATEGFGSAPSATQGFGETSAGSAGGLHGDRYGIGPAAEEGFGAAPEPEQRFGRPGGTIYGGQFGSAGSGQFCAAAKPIDDDGDGWLDRSVPQP